MGIIHKCCRYCTSVQPNYESARLWNDEISGKLMSLGFTSNPRDKCIFNKMTRQAQITIAVYVDDLMITSTDKQAILEVETALLEAYGPFRTTIGTTPTYLGCTRDYNTPGVVSICQTGMIQDLVSSRERTHEETKVTSSEHL
jgi:Reverse transcriptase (RNA-dependent DNA polymerase)